MDPTLSNDTNQVGTSTSVPNYLTPQQKTQMGVYANSLKNQQPAHSWTEGVGNMLNSYLSAQNSPTTTSPASGSGILGMLSSGWNNNPTQLPSANGGASGPPMQLPSANGGSPMNIFQGLFGGGNGSTS